MPPKQTETELVYQMAFEIFKPDEEKPIMRSFAKFQSRLTDEDVRKKAADLAALFPKTDLLIEISLVDTYTFEVKRKKSHLSVVKTEAQPECQ